MIRLEWKRFIRTYVWFGWWYSQDGWIAGWKFERHPGLRLLTVISLAEARRRASAYDDAKRIGGTK